MSSILNIKNLSKILQKKKILDNVEFSVEAGEIYGFLWPNWAGKTTTMKCIMGLVNYQWNIEILWEKGLTIKARKNIWFMPENTYLYKYLTGKEFLRFNANFFYKDKNKIEKKIENLLKKVWLEQDGNKYLSKYSKWMLQRIWLAQSIINDPQILFLDEPMSGLDPIGRKMIKDLLLELRDSGTTIFFNTHILADVESICDKISIINKWKIVVKDKKVSEIIWDIEEFFIKSVE